MSSFIKELFSLCHSTSVEEGNKHFLVVKKFVLSIFISSLWLSCNICRQNKLAHHLSVDADFLLLSQTDRNN